MLVTYKDDKKVKLGLIILEILFIIAALISIFIHGNSTLLGSLEKFDNDDVKYIRSAWNLVENGIFSYENVSKPTVYIMPGLTLILSFFVLIFGKFQAIVAFRIFQVIIQVCSLNLIFLIGRKIFNKKVAVVACISGSGLGLAISKNIIELHKGEIWIECENNIFKIHVKIYRN